MKSAAEQCVAGYVPDNDRYDEGPRLQESGAIL